MGMRNDIDWELIEREYRLGQKTLRQMESEFGVAASNISRKAKKEGWTQDKSFAVSNLSKAQLLANPDLIATNATKGATSNATPVALNLQVTDGDVLVAATARTMAVLSHRKLASRMKNLGEVLLNELEDQTINRDLYEQLGELLRSPDDKGMDKLNDIYMKSMSLPSRITSYKTMTDAYKNAIGIERQALNIDDNEILDSDDKVIKRIERVIVDVTPKQ